jgi:hypothetical protein
VDITCRKAFVCHAKPLRGHGAGFIEIMTVIEFSLLFVFYYFAATGKIWGLWILRILLGMVASLFAYLVLDSSQVETYRGFFLAICAQAIFALVMSYKLNIKARAEVAKTLQES